MSEKTLYEMANEIVKKTAGKKVVTTSNNNTGTTYFLNAKQRLCKVVLTKKAIKVECNIELSKEIIAELEAQKAVVTYYDKEQRKVKKLGTCQYIVNMVDNNLTEKLIKDMLANYKG